MVDSSPSQATDVPFPVGASQPPPAPGGVSRSCKEMRVTLGAIERLRATQQLATSTTACPPWCDGDHELTGDDQGISHHCAIEHAFDSESLGVHLRAKEPVDAPGTLGPTRLVVYSDAPEMTTEGWLIEIPIDARRLQTLREVVDAALALVEHQALSSNPRPASTE